jgi:hypothetical protein
MNSIKNVNWFKTCLIISIYFASLNLYSQGHYNGSSYNPNDYFVSSASGWVFSLYYSYSQMDYYNDLGDKTDVIEINENPPFSVEIGQKVKTHSVIPMILYFGKGKIMNANWGILALPIINNPNANIALDFYANQNISSSNNISIKSFGFGDFYLQPIWLTWEKNKFSTTFSYGFWIPVGKYEHNDPKNVGLGYWSHNFRVATRYKPKSKFSLTSAITFELNNKQKGNDFIEAPHITFDYGGSYNFTMGHEIGFFGFGTWPTGNDKGEKAVSLKDQYYGLGIYGSYWFVPGKFGVLSRFTNNFGTRNRFGGLSFQVGINYLLFNQSGKK